MSTSSTTTLQKSAEDAGENWDAEAMAGPSIASSLRENNLPIPSRGSPEWTWLVSQFDERLHQLSAWALEREEGKRTLPGDGALPHAPLSTESSPAAPSPILGTADGRSLSKLLAAY